MKYIQVYVHYDKYHCIQNVISPNRCIVTDTIKDKFYLIYILNLVMNHPKTNNTISSISLGFDINYLNAFLYMEYLKERINMRYNRV